MCSLCGRATHLASAHQGLIAPPNPCRSPACLFACYSEPDEDHIGVDGVQKFCEDLGVEPADIVMLVISYHMVRACVYFNGIWAVLPRVA